MLLSVSLPDPRRFQGQPIRLKLFGAEVTVQLTRLPNGATEQWVLSSAGSDYKAQTDAEIRPDGTAVTGQWRIDKCGGLPEGEVFTLVIVEGAKGYTATWVGQNDLLSNQHAREFKILTRTPISEDNVKPKDRDWVALQVREIQPSIRILESPLEPQLG